jgi:lycopene cyclase domain-containing protein
MSLYLIINILAVSIPLLFSFDKRVHFYRYWRCFFPSMILTMTFFIIWDVIFTSQGIWGFNEQYHGNWVLFGLPLEEYLFFITVPYASVFTIFVLKSYFPRAVLGDSGVRIVTHILVIFLVLMAAFNFDKAYTAINFIFAALIIGLVYLTRRELLRQFYTSYLVILVPFMIVNGILTGSFIEDQIVWYNDLENLGFRLGTIPVEDVLYGMSLILINYYLLETFRSVRIRQKAYTWHTLPQGLTCSD